MLADTRRKIRAVRLHPNVVVPQVVVGEDRTVAVVPAITAGTWTGSLKAKLGAIQRALGLDEGQFRECLRRDAELSMLADTEFPEPRVGLTLAEAELLIERGLADPVFDS